MDYDLDAMDMEMLNEARSILKKRWPEMVEGYLEDVQIYINGLKAGFENRDQKAVLDNAHPLKSSSSGMGVSSIGDIAHTIEYEAKSAIETGRDIEHLQQLIPLIEEALRLAQPKLRETVTHLAIEH